MIVEVVAAVVAHQEDVELLEEAEVAGQKAGRRQSSYVNREVPALSSIC